VAAVGGTITDISASAYKGALVFSTANNAAPAERVRIDSNGNVGIGTTAPGAKLDIGGGGESIRLSGTAAQAYMSFYNGTTRKGYVGTGAGGTDMILNADSGSIVLQGGNVGIGTTIPTSLLNVRPAANINTAVGSGVGDSTALQIAAVNDANSAYIPLEINASKTNFRWGNVGIGTSSPNARMDVAGDIRTSGHVFHGSLKDYRLVYRDDFESAATGWSNTTRTTCGPSTILGGYNVLSTTTVSRSFDLTGIPHTDVMVVATFYFLDTWDSEWGYMRLDGYPVWSRQHVHSNPANGNFCGQAGNYDQSATIIGSIQHTGNSLTVLFGSNLDSVPTDESYGVDNVEIWVR
jgi:hypothetical protein